MAYAILILSAILLELAVNVPMGSLPLALQADALAPATIAVAIGCGSVAALLGSSPIGELADRIGRVILIRWAAFFSVAALLSLTFAHGAIPNAVLMAARTLAMTAFITAEFAYASAIVPPERRVTAVATLGMVGNFAMALSPAIGVWLWQHGVGRIQFAYAAALAALGILPLFFLPRANDMPVHRSRRIMMRSAWIPTVAFLVTATLAGGVNFTLAVITFHARGIVNGALLFTAMAGTTFALRYPAGRLVDRFGARAVAVPTALLHFTGALLAATAYTVPSVIASGVVGGMAWAAMVPVGIALLFERSSNGTRGAAMGAYSFSLALGMTLGAALAAVSSATGLGYPVAIALAGTGPLLALPWVLANAPGTRRRAALAAGGAR